jgi:phage shock protein A
MQARAGAIDELIASGALEDASSLNQGDDIARELEAESSHSEVEAELARLKGGGAPPAIEGGEDGDILEAEPQAQASESKDTP